MADGEPPKGNGSIPYAAQLALAMAIVRQKPAHLDIKDYIFQMRSFIAKGKEPHPVSLSDKFFDSVSFWQQAYEKSEAEQSKLLDRIFELEQRNEALHARSQTANFGGDEKASESSKRKANPKNAGGAATARKRAKTQAPVLTTGIQDGNANIIDMIEFKEENTGPFMRHFYTLQKVLQKRPNRSSIVQAAVDLSTTAASNLLDSVQEKKAAAGRSTAIIVLQKKDPEIGSVIRSVENAMKLLYQALAKLCATEGAVSDIGKVSYHIVRLYDAAMKMLEQYCMVRAEQMLAPSKPNAKSKRKQGAKPQRPELRSDDELASQITRLLGTMTLSLDLAYEEHQELMQGALYFLMNRVGRLLCLFVFQDLQVRPDLRIDSSKLPLPQGLKDVNVNEKSLCAAKLEAKHLIWVLERILTYLNANQPSPTTQKFTEGIKESLQSTILQSVFGTDDDCFQKSLKLPTFDTCELAKLRLCAQIPEQAVPDWFVQEVWRLLGWDMLTKDCQKE